MVSDPADRICSRAGTTAQVAGTGFPRRRVTRNSPELAELGLPGVNSIGVWVKDGLRDMRNPPGPKTARGEVLNAGRDGGGGTTRWHIASARVRAVLGVRGERCDTLGVCTVE